MLFFFCTNAAPVGGFCNLPNECICHTGYAGRDCEIGVLLTRLYYKCQHHVQRAVLLCLITSKGQLHGQVYVIIKDMAISASVGYYI